MKNGRKLIYGKIVLKLTGQIFSASSGALFSGPRMGKIAEEIRPLIEKGVKIILIAGGGNIFRGRDLQIPGFDRKKADEIGMLATVQNSLFLGQMLKCEGIKNKLFTAIRMDDIAEYYTCENAASALEENRCILISCGLGKPYCSTDYASMVYALDLGAKAVLKGTKVDGLYDKDPKTDKKAKLIQEISYKKAISLGLEKIMDTSALGLAIDRKEEIFIHVFNIFEKGNLLRVLLGEKIGSKIMP